MLPQEHINKAVANFTEPSPNWLHGCGCQWWSLRASAITLSMSNSLHPDFITNKPALFRATNGLRVKTTLETLRNGVVSVEAA